ncbi:hypothetical protein Y032_0387g454 [Ancylostoma ceylanicum]|uniref:Uncharacterized protein n=1 Tax=Ancylostoma ceylanicum TaxID=53326 RepID=A0A016RSH7_9BILA|nr:hypothetical protein Y032_0387g454 [Ancylostoma ceylanicum]
MEGTPDRLEDPAKSPYENLAQANKKRSIVFQTKLAAGQDSGNGQMSLGSNNEMLVTSYGTYRSVTRAKEDK